MNFRRFLLDQWRVALFFLLGTVLTLAVFGLAIGFSGVHVPTGDVIYSVLLAMVCFVVYIGIEFLVRRPFYREMQMRLKPGSPLHSADLFTEARTAEQQLFLELLHQHCFFQLSHSLPSAHTFCSVRLQCFLSKPFGIAR